MVPGLLHGDGQPEDGPGRQVVPVLPGGHHPDSERDGVLRRLLALERHLRRHHPLPLGDQVALAAGAVAEAAVPLVALQPGDDAVVPAAGALGAAGALVLRGGQRGGGGGRRQRGRRGEAAAAAAVMGGGRGGQVVDPSEGETVHHPQAEGGDDGNL